MTKEKHPRPKTRMLRSRYATNSSHHNSNRLTREYQLGADDLNPGSHLEAGDLAKRRMYPSGGLEGTPVTSHPETRKRRASVDHDTVGDLSPQTDGMSEYPVPHISRARMGEGYAPECKMMLQ